MANFADEVEAALAGSGIILKADLLRWMSDGDLATKARVYTLTDCAWSRIKPEPSMEEQCGFMASYLLECLAANPESDDFVHGGFEAGHVLAAWLTKLAQVPEAAPVIQDVERRLQGIYRACDATIRNRIETGALEHILEAPRLRPFFAHWRDDDVLRDAYEPALKWGLAHERLG